METEGYSPVRILVIAVLCLMELGVVAFAVGMFGDFMKG